MPILMLLATIAATASPVGTAQLLYQNLPDFYIYPEKARPLLSERLHKLLSAEARCTDGMQCAIGTYPWTGAQDGDIQEPITFNEISRSSSISNIQMCYHFFLGAEPAANQCSTIVMVQTSTGHWVMDDLLDPSGYSLRHTLESYDYGL
ncbi:hypothetical protein [Luteimonas vadosa]|uniref:DUF3828 domain-containing protein n=1 Tax=Luteimonas vadosa TaxID=1165507 RepID=A0ABP9DZK1_9GAMM